MVETVFSQLEKLARDWQIKYMSGRKTTEVTEAGRIRFHPQDARKWILKEYRKKLKELKI